MANETINKIRKAFNDSKNQEKITKPLDRISSLFEESLKEQLVKYEKIDFNDVVLYEQKDLSISACYFCNQKVLVLLNVVASPAFVTHWKIKNNEEGQKIEQALVFFESGSHGVAELVLSKYEIEKRR